MELIHDSPKLEDHIHIRDWQSTTPQSFATPNVLYYHSSNARLSIPAQDLARAPALQRLKGSSTSTNDAPTNGASHPTERSTDALAETRDVVDDDEDKDEEEEAQPEVVIHDLDIWVASKYLTLYSPSTSTGVRILYPSISLHAISSFKPPDAETEHEHDTTRGATTTAGGAELQGLYMQLDTSDGFDDYDDSGEGMLEMTLIPVQITKAGDVLPPLDAGIAAEAANGEAEGNNDTSRSTVASTPSTKYLFKAVSACADLHPDPPSQGSGSPDVGDVDMEMEDGGGKEEDGAYSVLQGPGGGSGSGGGGRGANGLPPAFPGSGGWITAENVGEFFDAEGNWRGGGLGPGAGIVRMREEDEEDEEGGDDGDGRMDDAEDGGTTSGGINGGNGDVAGEETKWRRTG
ncbi:hypothetical protein MMC25_008120 [Agyrium rufum]|nr:hypothetical protein [Agyrium rufum]